MEIADGGINADTPTFTCAARMLVQSGKPGVLDGAVKYFSISLRFDVERTKRQGVYGVSCQREPLAVVELSVKCYFILPHYVNISTLAELKVNKTVHIWTGLRRL